MNERVPIIPSGWKVVGRLYDTQFPELLNQDMIEISHGDILIHAGWEPENDVDGHYVIMAFRGSDVIVEPINVMGMDAALERLTLLADELKSSHSDKSNWYDIGTGRMLVPARQRVRIGSASESHRLETCSV